MLICHGTGTGSQRRPKVKFLIAALCATLLCLSAQAAEPGAEDTTAPQAIPADAGTQIMTIGTGGGPRPQAKRGQPATVVKVGEQVYLVDAGPGVSHTLATAGIRAKSIDKVFITHLHLDHFGGLNSLLGAAWVDGASKPIDIYGPPATTAFVGAGVTYLKMVLDLYAAQMAPIPSIAELVRAHDVDATSPVVIYQDEKVKVSAVENTHYYTLPADRRPIGGARSYSYRFDTPGRSIVFTGDTGPSEGLDTLAKGADVLVSMVHDLDRILVDLKYDGKNEKLKPLVDHYRFELLTPQDVGKLAAKAGIKTVILNHVSHRDDNEAGMRAFTQGVRAEFSGTVTVARDGDIF